jgi:hypothetical protein
MNDPITITEVVGRAVQGMTRPFLCKAGFSDYYTEAHLILWKVGQASSLFLLT